MLDDFDFDSILEEELALNTSTSTSNLPSIRVPLDGDMITIQSSSLAFPHGETINSLHEEISIYTANMQARRNRLLEIANEIEQLKKGIATRIQELSEERIKIDESLFDERRRKRELERQLGIAEALLRQALDTEKMRARLKQDSAKFDKLTMGAYWREFAFEHQIEGAKMIASGERVVLADKMGLGKTLTSLIACDMMQSKKILIVAPDDVASNFMRECAQWAPHRTIVMMARQPKGARNMALALLKDLSEFCVVINYSAWRKDSSLLHKLTQLRFDTMIMDEAHTIKETTTSAYKGCAILALAENSCPSCRGAIQKINTSKEIIDAIYPSTRYSKDYYVCVGNGATTTAAIASGMSRTLSQHGCGWNQILDLQQEITREYGSLRSVKRIIPMTGTPILNKPVDLFAILSLVDPLNFNDKHKFNDTYCNRDYSGKWKFKDGGLLRLVTNIAGKYLSRDQKTAGVVLPKHTEIIHSIEMDPILYPQQAKVIKDLSKHAMIVLQGAGEQEVKVPILYIISLITRKRQANVWPAGIELKDPDGVVTYSVGDEVRESIKLDRIILPANRSESGEAEGLIPDMVGEGFISGDRIVVFSQFKTPLIELENRLATAGISTVRFDGDTPSNIREQVKVDFDRKYCEQEGYIPKWQVVLCNYRTGGVGLNFTAATQAIFLDEEWNPGKADQAANRISRIGQTQETMVHILRIERTIDDWMAALNTQKANLIEGFETEVDLQEVLFKALGDEEMQ